MKFFPALFSLSIAIATGFVFSPKVAIAQSNIKISQTNQVDSAYQKDLNRLIQDGDAKFQQKDLQGAIAIYQRALQLAKQNQDLHSQVGLLVGIGRVYDLKGQYLDAERAFNQGLQILPQLAEQPSTVEKRVIQSHWRVLLLTGLGIVYSNLGEYTKASERLKLAVLTSNQTITKPTVLIHFEPRFKLAELYQKQEKYKEAIDVLQHCRIIATQLGDRQLDAMTLTAIGNNFTKMGKLNLARQFYDQATALESSSPEPQITNAPNILNALLGESANLSDFFDKMIPSLQKASRGIREVDQLTSSDSRFAVVGKLADNLDKTAQGLSDTLTNLKQGDWSAASQIMKSLQNDMTDFAKNTREFSNLMNSMQQRPEEFSNLNRLSPEIIKKLNESTRELNELGRILGVKQKDADNFKRLKKNDIKLTS